MRWEINKNKRLEEAQNSCHDILEQEEILELESCSAGDDLDGLLLLWVHGGIKDEVLTWNIRQQLMKIKRSELIYGYY